MKSLWKTILDGLTYKDLAGTQTTACLYGDDRADPASAFDGRRHGWTQSVSVDEQGASRTSSCFTPYTTIR